MADYQSIFTGQEVDRAVQKLQNWAHGGFTTPTTGTPFSDAYDNVTINGQTYAVLWRIAPTSTNTVYGVGLDIVSGRIYQIKSTLGVYSAVALDYAGTDTKNTAGATNSTSKLWLVGAGSQSSEPQTYTHISVYQEDGSLHANALYENNTRVLTAHAAEYGKIKVTGGEAKTADSAQDTIEFAAGGNLSVARDGDKITYSYTTPSSLKNPNKLNLKVNSETSNFVEYDGSATKTVTLKPSSTDGALIVSDGTTDKTIQLAGTFTDTLNTAGSTNTTAKIYLIGAGTQGANPQTYSNQNVYVENGVLYNGSKPVLVDHQNEYGKIKVGNTTTTADAVQDTIEFAKSGDLTVSISGDKITYGYTAPTSLKNPNALGIRANDDTTDLVSYDGSAAKTLSVKASSTAGAIELTDGSATKVVQLAGVFTDTTNTAGSTNSTSKLFLIGAGSQTTDPQTYSNIKVYEQDGKLYSNDSEVVNLADAQTITGQKTIVGQTRIKASAAASSADNLVTGFQFWKSTTSTYSKTSTDYLGLISSNDNGYLGFYGRTGLYFRPVMTNGTVNTNYGVTMESTGMFPGSTSMPLGKSDKPWGQIYVNQVKITNTSTEADVTKGSNTYKLPANSGTLALESSLPSVSNATITIKQAGIATDQTFTLNGSATTITLNDTKNTAGATNSTAKLYLVGSGSQTDGVQTYTYSGIYEENGTLYVPNIQVSGNITDGTISIPVEDIATSDDIEDVMEVAAGKTATFVANITDNASLNSQNASVELTSLVDIAGNTHTVADVKVGDTIYVTDQSVPDRWVSSIANNKLTCLILETAKVPITSISLNSTAITPNNGNVNIEVPLNHVGSTNSASKLFLVGAGSQAAHVQSYSNSAVYATNGTLTAANFQTAGNLTDGTTSITIANIQKKVMVKRYI